MMVWAGKTNVPVKTFNIRYAARDYTFPKEVKIASVRFDGTHMHVTLTDKRIISIPLTWIPTLYYAKPAEREKYKINQTKRMLVWDHSKCEINEEIRIEDYLGAKAEANDFPKVAREKKGIYKTSRKKK